MKFQKSENFKKSPKSKEIRFRFFENLEIFDFFEIGKFCDFFFKFSIFEIS